MASDGKAAKPVRIVYNARARRMILRLDQRDGVPVLTAPPGVARSAIDQFLSQQQGWIARQSASRLPIVPLVDGAVFPFRGEDHVIRHCPALPRSPVIADGFLHVGGAGESLDRRIIRFLRSEARSVLSERVALHAQCLGVTPTRITIRDTRSRWGSCSAKGALNFSWRLIMAPPSILDYVAAHEVAHLLEMNHSARFWAHVDRLVDNRTEARKWLRSHGHDLMRIAGHEFA